MSVRAGKGNVKMPHGCACISTVSLSRAGR